MAITTAGGDPEHTWPAAPMECKLDCQGPTHGDPTPALRPSGSVRGLVGPGVEVQGLINARGMFVDRNVALPVQRRQKVAGLVVFLAWFGGACLRER